MPEIFKIGAVNDMYDVENGGIVWPKNWNTRVELQGKGYTGRLDYQLRLVDKSEDMGGASSDYNNEVDYTYLIWCDKLDEVVIFLKFLGIDKTYNFYKST